LRILLPAQKPACEAPILRYAGKSRIVGPDRFFEQVLSLDYCKEAGRGSPAEPDRTRGKTMFAVIKTGGKQYRVAATEEITIMKLAGNPGDVVTFSDVLLVDNEGAVQLGAPFVAGASVKAEILEQARGPKVISFKKRRRKNSKRKRGHRQDLTYVRITEVVA
jgi:large subunit ribosomal protein L21